MVACKFFENTYNRDPAAFLKKNILELGAGTGICSIALSVYGANVVATDLPEILPLLNHNIEKNSEILKGSLIAKDLNWGERNLGMRFDMILLIDCLYYEASLEPLLETIKSHGIAQTEIILIYEERDIGRPASVQKQFFDLAKLEFDISKIENSELHPDYCSSDIHALRLKLK